MKKEDEIVIKRDIYDIITDLKDALRTQDAIMKMLTEQSKPQPVATRDLPVVERIKVKR